MSTWRSLVLGAVLSASSTGCVLYFGDGNNNGDDDTICPEAGGTRIALAEQRNPWTGECVTQGGIDPCGTGGVPVMDGGVAPGGTVIDGGMAPSGGGASDPAVGGGGAPWYNGNWGFCYANGCEGMAEDQCLAADGCRAIYIDSCPPWADCASSTPQFSACWSVALDGPITGGDCTAITDAEECSRHNDCSAFHEWKNLNCPADGLCGNEPGSFLSCMDEPGGNPPPPPPPPPPASCDGLGESVCIDMADGCVSTSAGPSCGGPKCEPIYEGSGCMCDAMGNCTCTSWAYQYCRAQ